MMRHWSKKALACWVCAALGLAVAVGSEQPGLFREEIWESAHVEGSCIGHVHTTVEALPGSEGKKLRITQALHLAFQRQRAAVRLRMDQGTEETADGKVLGVFMRQYHEQGQQLELIGTVQDDVLRVVVDGGRIKRELPWSEEVVGLGRLLHVFQERKPSPGETFSLHTFEPTINAVVTLQVAVRQREEVELPGGRKSLLRVEMTPEKIVTPRATVQLPATVWWLDETFVPLRRQIELDGLGTVVLLRTTRTQATAPATGTGRTTDIGLKTLIPLNRPVARPFTSRGAVYRVTVKGDPEPATALVQDSHQEIREVRGNTLEVVVHPQSRKAATAQVKDPGPEVRASCHYIDSSDPRVQELARQAVGEEQDPWRKALRLEGWVKRNMRVDNAAPMVPASQTARELRGDCRMYALLTAALCRAQGIPARTALGLIQVDRGGRSFMGFHMWAEVWIDGQWLGLDATLGQGGVGTAHLKISDHSWFDTPSLTPFLAVNRVLGKLTIEVVGDGER
jgi:hypothetical protein